MRAVGNHTVSRLNTRQRLCKNHADIIEAIPFAHNQSIFMAVYNPVLLVSLLGCFGVVLNHTGD